VVFVLLFFISVKHNHDLLRPSWFIQELQQLGKLTLLLRKKLYIWKTKLENQIGKPNKSITI